jgi:hypothetical protein
VEPPRNPWRPLGQLLVELGLITTNDLGKALSEQRRSGRRLGEIVVERGLISWPTLTRVLAAQYGLELLTETGFGTGLRTEIERRHSDRRGGVDRRQQEDRRQTERRQVDSAQTPAENGAVTETRATVPKESAQTQESGNSRTELEVLRATHHAWLSDLTETLREQHGYLASAAEKIEEHERTLTELRQANGALNAEIESLRMELKQPQPGGGKRSAKASSRRA